MSVKNLISRLKSEHTAPVTPAPVTPVTPANTHGVTAENAHIYLISHGKLTPVTPVTPVTPEKVESQNKNADFSHAALGEPGCSNCEAATRNRWHGGYTMHCVGCVARLVASARPNRQIQEAMLSCLELPNPANRTSRPTRQQVLERLQRR